MRPNVQNEWTKEELQALREHYPSQGARWDGWDSLLNHRSISAIQTKACAMGVTNPKDPQSSRVTYIVQMTPDPMARKVKKMHDKGLTVREIDSALKMPTGAARMIMTKIWEDMS